MVLAQLSGGEKRTAPYMPCFEPLSRRAGEGWGEGAQLPASPQS
ncbi:hypothetical protein [Lysobacter gummosus]